MSFSNNTSKGGAPTAPSNVDATSSPKSTISTTPDENTIRLGTCGKCPISSHEKGHFCFKCRYVATSWTEIPWKNDEEGKRIVVGPNGSLLEGAVLDNEEAVATVCVMAYSLVKTIPAESIPGFSSIMDRHPASVTAGKRVTDVYFEYINQVAPSEIGNDLLTFWSIIEIAMNCPEINAEGCLKRALKVSQQMTKGDDNDDDDGEADIEAEEGEAEDESAWISRPFLTENQAHAPAEKGMWKLAEGTDISPAVQSCPDPSKFFILRQDRNDPEHFDVRQYTHLQTFDWDEKSHIDALNRARSQIISRTNKNPVGVRPQWSQKEKDKLEEAVKEQLLDGKTKSTLDWDLITRSLQDKLVGVTQEIGEPLAQTYRKVNGKEWLEPKEPKEPKKSKNSKKPTQGQLKTQRVGPVHRTTTAVKSQAFKYESIVELIDRYPDPPKTKGKGKGKRGIDQEEKAVGSSSKSALLDSAPQDNPTNKKRKLDVGAGASGALNNGNNGGFDTPIKSQNTIVEATEATTVIIEDKKNQNTKDSLTMSSPVTHRPKEDKQEN